MGQEEQAGGREKEMGGQSWKCDAGFHDDVSDVDPGTARKIKTRRDSDKLWINRFGIHV
jgi:hypothetical protein